MLGQCRWQLAWARADSDQHWPDGLVLTGPPLYLVFFLCLVDAVCGGSALFLTGAYVYILFTSRLIHLDINHSKPYRINPLISAGDAVRWKGRKVSSLRAIVSSSRGLIL